MKIKHKNIFLNSVFMLLTETVTIVLLLLFIGIGLRSGKIDFIRDLKFVLLGPMIFFFIGILIKFVLEFIPKMLIQYILIVVYGERLRMPVLWCYLFILGIIVSLMWWSDANYKLGLKFGTLMAAYNLVANAVSPFILNLFGWDIVQKIIHPKLKEEVK